MDTSPSSSSAQPPRPKPEDMRAAMADYVRTVHQSYLTVAQLQSPVAQAEMPLLARPFTVVAAGVRNLHVIATHDPLPSPTGPEVTIADEVGPMRWSVRFFDPVVLPALGMIDESDGAAGAEVRRAIGIATHLYHLIVQPGSELTAHHAGHAGTGLGNAHVAAGRDFDAIRERARGREELVDEMAGAARAGLDHAHALLAQAISADDRRILGANVDRAEVRKRLLEALRSADG